MDSLKSDEPRVSKVPLMKKRKKVEVREKKAKKLRVQKTPLARVASAPAQLMSGVIPSTQNETRSVTSAVKPIKKPTSLPIQKLNISEPSEMTQTGGRVVGTLEQRIMYPGKDTLIQLTGQGGQKYAITAEKARELFGLQLAPEKTSTASDAAAKRSYETTKQLLSLPPAVLKSIDSKPFQKKLLPAVPTTTAAVQNQSERSTPDITPVTSAPTTPQRSTDLSTNQIRQLLAVEGTSFLVASPAKSRPSSAVPSSAELNYNRGGQSLVTGRLFKDNAAASQQAPGVAVISPVPSPSLLHEQPAAAPIPQIRTALVSTLPSTNLTTSTASAKLLPKPVTVTHSLPSYNNAAGTGDTSLTTLITADPTTCASTAVASPPTDNVQQLPGSSISQRISLDINEVIAKAVAGVYRESVDVPAVISDETVITPDEDHEIPGIPAMVPASFSGHDDDRDMSEKI